MPDPAQLNGRSSNRPSHQHQPIRNDGPTPVPRLPRASDEPIHRSFQSEAIARAIRTRMAELDHTGPDQESQLDCSCDTLQRQLDEIHELVDRLAVGQRAFYQELAKVSQSTGFHHQQVRQQMTAGFGQLQEEAQNLRADLHQSLAHSAVAAAPPRGATALSTPAYNRLWQHYAPSTRWAFSGMRLLGFAAFFFILTYVAAGFLGLEQLTQWMGDVSIPVFQSLAVVALASFATASLLEAFRHPG